MIYIQRVLMGDLTQVVETTISLFNHVLRDLGPRDLSHFFQGL